MNVVRLNWDGSFALPKEGQSEVAIILGERDRKDIWFLGLLWPSGQYAFACLWSRFPFFKAKVGKIERLEAAS